MSITATQALDRAVAMFSNEGGLAKAVGYTRPVICRARKTGLPSAELCCCIEYATKGLVRRVDLRPDIFGSRARMIVNPWNRMRPLRGGESLARSA